MKTKDIVRPTGMPPAVNPTAENPNGLAHEQAQMDVAISEVQEDLLELYKRFTDLRDTYARLKMRRDQSAVAATPSAVNQPRAVAEARGRVRLRR